MEEKQLHKSFKNSYMLTGILLLFIVVFWIFNYFLTNTLSGPDWDMRGKSFVPASSLYGNGYYHQVDPQYGGSVLKKEAQRE